MRLLLVAAALALVQGQAPQTEDAKHPNICEHPKNEMMKKGCELCEKKFHDDRVPSCLRCGHMCLERFEHRHVCKGLKDCVEHHEKMLGMCVKRCMTMAPWKPKVRVWKGVFKNKKGEKIGCWEKVLIEKDWRKGDFQNEMSLMGFMGYVRLDDKGAMKAWAWHGKNFKRVHGKKEAARDSIYMHQPKWVADIEQIIRSVAFGIGEATEMFLDDLHEAKEYMQNRLDVEKHVDDVDPEEATGPAVTLEDAEAPPVAVDENPVIV
jgi:hypothetical protein